MNKLLRPLIRLRSGTIAPRSPGRCNVGSPAAGGQMNLFSWQFLCRMGGGDESGERGENGGVNLILPVTPSRFVTVDISSPIPCAPVRLPDPLSLFFSFDNLPKHFIFFSRLIRGDILRFSLVVDGLHLSPSFSVFPLRTSLSFFFSYPHPLGWGLSASEHTASLCFLRAIRAQTKRLISLKPG